MKLLRYSNNGLAPAYGWIDEDKIGEIEGSPFSAYRRYDPVIPINSVQILPPCEPSKIICVGRNYLAHAKEQDAETPELPLLFLKPPSALISSGDPIVIPPQSSQVEHEAELAVIIGKAGRWIDTINARDFILGYTIANDVTARDLQQRDNQWTRGKGFDTFCPLGPWMETDFDPADAMISCHVDNQLRQMGTTRDMLFTVQQLIAFISSVMTLLPGDVILTGTPAGVGPLLPGNTVSVQIEGIGSLSNPVIGAQIANS